jgi:Zn-dependent protease
MSSWTPETYTIGYRPFPKARGLSTSATEIAHALVAFLVLTFDFSVIWVLIEYGQFGYVNATYLLPALPLGAIAALSGFLVHEGAHKVAAERYGFWAEFRMSPFGLLLSVLLVLTTGIIFAAPGATMVRGMGDTREWGRTSLAGPIVNLAAGAGFGVAGLATSAFAAGSLNPLSFLTFLNIWWAAFNLIPLGPLDGAKVWRWDHRVWAGAFVPAAALSALLYLVLFFRIAL